jgi:excisionase family DNA binding protein
VGSWPAGLGQPTSHRDDPPRGDSDVETSATLLPWIERILVEIEGIRDLLEGRRKDYYTTVEIADAVGRSEYTVRRWIAAGLLPAVRVDGTGPRGRLLVPRSAFEDLVRSGRAGKVSATTLG